MYEEEDIYGLSAKGSQNKQSLSNPSKDHNGTSASSSSQCGFHCVAPSTKKRQEVLEAQVRANDNYEQYREKSRLGYVSDKGRVGGSASEVDARHRAQQQQYNAKKERQRKQEQYKADKRRQEEEECAKIKADGRRKAELLERRSIEEHDRRQKAIQEDHHRTNEAFLAKLEGRSGSKHTSSGESYATTTSRVADAKARDDVDDPLLRLVHLFPRIDLDVLDEMLQKVNYDASQVERILSE